MDRPEPDGFNVSLAVNDTCFDGRQTGYGGICPIGHYCPGGMSSIFPIPCGNGTYADEEGLAACKSCPGGICVKNHVLTTQLIKTCSSCIVLCKNELQAQTQSIIRTVVPLLVATLNRGHPL